MTPSPKFRALAIVFCFAALTGCGKSGPTTTESKKDEPKPDAKVEPKAKPNPDTTAQPFVEPKSTLSPVEPAAEQIAFKFLQDVGQGTANADMLSAGFMKSVGKPLILEQDIKAGVSRDAATYWLKNVGMGRSFSPSLDRKQAGDVIYLRGALQGQPGSYAMRMIKESGAWKVDWFALTSVDTRSIILTGTPDAAFQEFAVTSFVEVMTDLNAMTQENRAPLLAHGMVPALRLAWAPPFEGDKAQGYDYSRSKLAIKAIEFGGGTTTFNLTQVGDLPEFKVELTKPAGKKHLIVRLAKGNIPGEWLVNEVIETKG